MSQTQEQKRYIVTRSIIYLFEIEPKPTHDVPIQIQVKEILPDNFELGEEITLQIYINSISNATNTHTRYNIEGKLVNGSLYFLTTTEIKVHGEGGGYGILTTPYP